MENNGETNGRVRREWKTIFLKFNTHNEHTLIYFSEKYSKSNISLNRSINQLCFVSKVKNWERRLQAPFSQNQGTLKRPRHSHFKEEKRAKMKSHQRRVTLPWIQWGIWVFLENNGNIRRWIRPLKTLSKNIRRDSKCKNGRETGVWLLRLNLKPT